MAQSVSVIWTLVHMDAHIQSFNDKTTVDYAASGSIIATVCGGVDDFTTWGASLALV